MGTLFAIGKEIVGSQFEPIDSGDSVSVTADGVKTYGQLLTELQAKIDYDRITVDSLFAVGVGYYTIQYAYNGLLETYRVRSGGSATFIYEIILSNSSCTYQGRNVETGTVTDYSSTVLANGVDITLYYNSITKVIESCDAEDVSYESGTVADALDSLTASMANTFVELGNQNDIGGAWDALTVYDRPVLCAWTKNGRHWGLLYKYTGGQFGMGISQAYYSTVINVLSVSGGTKTIKTLTAQ